MPTRRPGRLTAATAALAAGCLLATAAPSGADPTPTPTASAAEAPATTGTGGDEPGSLLLVLDASGSMKRPDPSGLTKIEAAKKALTGVVRELPDDVRVGLRVYGARVDGGGRPTKAACADTRLEVPVGPLDRAAMTGAIGRFRAVGETPIATSLEKAVADLGPSGKRTVVLVSDGEESCVPDPCPVVRRLVGAGIDLRIDTVGFGVDAAARRQLQCVAAAGGGTYYDARDADQLATNLARISVRAARRFGTSGTRVSGTASAAGAPALGPGQYVDTVTSGAPPKHYVLHRTIARSTLHVSVVARPKVTLSGATDNDDAIEFRPTDADGRLCTSLPGRAQRIGLSSLAYVLSDSLILEGGTDEQPADCGDLLDVPMTLTRTGSDEPVDAELLVVEEPPVDAVDTLPSPAEEVDPRPSPLGSARPVLGGSGFGDATPITAGTWSEQYVSGETIYYRVPVGWGQSVTVTAGPVLPTTEGRTGPLFDANLFDPGRGLVQAGSLATVGDEDARVVRQTPPVRYRNREDFPVRFTSLAGQYYLAIAVPKVDEGVTVPMDVTFRVEVTGEVTGTPAYRAAAAPTTSPSASGAPSPAATGAARRDDGTDSPPWLWPAVGALVLLLVAAGVAVLRRRART